MTTLGAIVPVRDRGGVTLENAIAAARPQVDILYLVDYGSGAACAAEMQRLSVRYGTLLYRLATAGRPWNKAHALNYAIKRAATDVLAVVDADCVVPPSWGALARKYAPRRFFVVPPVFDLAEPVTARASWVDLCDREGQPRPASGDGNMAVLARWLRAVRGFDEDFVGWGKEDNDMHLRALAAGFRDLPPVVREDCEVILHQPHPTRPVQERDRESRTNELLLQARAGSVERNQGRPWGEAC